MCSKEATGIVKPIALIIDMVNPIIATRFPPNLKTKYDRIPKIKLTITK